MVRTIRCLLSLVGVLSAQTHENWPIPGPNALKAPHPGWDLADLLPATLPNGFTAYVAGMGFLPNGKLAIADFPNPEAGSSSWEGSVWLLDGVLSGDKTQVKPVLFKSGLRAPGGVSVVGSDLYLVDSKSLKKLSDADSNGTAETSEISGAYTQSSGQPAIQDLVYRSGFFYTSAGGSSNTLGGTRIAGSVVKFGMDGKFELMCTGLRNPNGLAFNEQGDLFTTDNQGEWVPSDKFIHVVKGKYYGFQPLNTNNLQETPPAVWIPHGTTSAPKGDASIWPAGLSPAGPVFIKTGPYAGQALVGDVRYGNIHRIFLEKVNGEYQGALFHFAGGLKGGVNRMVWGPDGALYLGIIGSPNFAWSWKENNLNDNWGVQRLKKNEKDFFEIVSVQARLGGFELKFNHPVGSGAALASKYKIQSWWYLPSTEYGGPQKDMTTLPVKSTQVSADGMSVFLEVPGLQAKHVVHIELDSNQVVSDQGLKPWTFETWYTLNALSTETPLTTTGHLPMTEHNLDYHVFCGQGGSIAVSSSSAGAFLIRDIGGHLRGKIILSANENRKSGNRFPSGLYFVSKENVRATPIPVVIP